MPSTRPTSTQQNQHSRAKTQSADKNLELVQRMGAPSYDPMPTDQYACFIDAEFSISARAHRMLAQVRSDCLELKAGGRTPFAAPPGHHGGKRFLMLRDLGSKLGWDPSSTIRVSNELVDAGLIRIDEQGRIWLCGKVAKKGRTDAHPEAPLNSDEAWEKFCTDNFPRYMSLKLKQLPKTDRDRVRADVELWQGFEKRACAEAIKGARDQVQEQRDRHFAERYGVAARRFERKPKSDEEAPPEPLVKLSVQNFSELFVHVEKPGLYNVKTDPVQTSSNKKEAENRESEHACMHALDDLRGYFPEDYISDDALAKLDGFLSTQLGGSYDRDAFLGFVGRRARNGRIRSGLVFFDLEKGLPGDFCRWAIKLSAAKEQQARREHAANDRDPALERWRAEQESALSDPGLSNQEKNLIRDCLGLPREESKSREAGRA